VSKALTAMFVPWIALVAAAVMPSLVSAHAQPLVVENAWVRKVPGVDSAAAYFVLKNTSEKPVTVVSVRSSVAAHAMMHETTVVDGQSRMRMREKIVIEAGKSVAFAPEGLHVMLSGFTKEVAVGDTVRLFLQVEGGHPLSVAALVRPLDAK
jgi:periplasmic copper chaperone A